MSSGAGSRAGVTFLGTGAGVKKVTPITSAAVATLFQIQNKNFRQTSELKSRMGRRATQQNQCCHCCFFSLDLGFFCFICGSGVFIKNLVFFTLVKV